MQPYPLYGPSMLARRIASVSGEVDHAKRLAQAGATVAPIQLSSDHLACRKTAYGESLIFSYHAVTSEPSPSCTVDG